MTMQHQVEVDRSRVHQGARLNMIRPAPAYAQQSTEAEIATFVRLSYATDPKTWRIKLAPLATAVGR